MKLSKMLAGLALVATVLFSSFSTAEAVVIDDLKGLNTVCFGTNGYGCTSGQGMYLGVGLLPDMEANGYGLEGLAVYNVEIFDDSGYRLYQGIPRTVRFRNNGSTQATAWMFVPPSATYWLSPLKEVWLEVWVYVSGPNLQNGDSRQFWIPINLAPCTPETCGGGEKG